MTCEFEEERGWHRRMVGHIAGGAAAPTTTFGLPIPSFERILTALYRAEIDIQMANIFDCGIRLSLGFHNKEGWRTRVFSVGERDDEYSGWADLWFAAIMWICEEVYSEWESLEDGAWVDIGCLDCTMNTTPVRLTTGLCIVHIAKELLVKRGMPQADRSATTLRDEDQQR